MFAVVVSTALGCDVTRSTGIGEGPVGGVGSGGASVGSGSGSGSGAGGGQAQALTVALSGRVLDYGSQAAMAHGSVTAYGVWPVTAVDLNAAGAFRVPEMPMDSTVTLLFSGDGYLPTWSLPVALDQQDRAGVEIAAVPTAWKIDLAVKLGVSPALGSGVVLVQLVDAKGAPLAGVPRSGFALDVAADGPYLLDEKNQPLVDATATTSSGRAVFFGVAPGRVELRSTSNAVSIVGASAVVVAGGAALASASVSAVE